MSSGHLAAHAPAPSCSCRRCSYSLQITPLTPPLVACPRTVASRTRLRPCCGVVARPAPNARHITELTNMKALAGCAGGH